MSHAESYSTVFYSRRPPIRVKPKHEYVELRKNVAKPLQKTTKSVPSKSMPNDGKLNKDIRVEKRDERVAPTATDGLHELSPLMTRMVEAELQDIMIKVWQELPDDPSDDAEELVVDKLRNKAGDDLRNALGLNITKRLLNVHNPLFVKIQFTGKPEKVHLSAFLKKYNFNAFKRIESTVNTFAAQVRTIADFDRICSTKDIRCGNIKVTVNPCYRFTKRPPNLKTCFHDNEEDRDDTENKEKDIDIKEMCGIEDKQSETKPIGNKHPEEIKKDEKEKVVIKEKPKEETTEVQSAEKKNTPIKTVAAKPQTEVKATVETKIPGKSTANVTPEIKKEIANKELNIQNANNVEDKKVVTQIKKVTPVKGNEVVNKQLNAKNVVAKKVETKKAAVSAAKVTKGSIAVCKPNAHSKKNDKVEDDFDELDDYDILALMSGGIVLDECSGSDDE